MNSKIRIELNFDNYEPYIQLQLESGDVNDGALKHFVEQANMRGIELVYHNLDNSNNTPQIKLKQKDSMITSEETKGSLHFDICGEHYLSM